MNDRELRLEQLHLWRGDRHVLRGVSCSVSSGQCLQVTGPNGAGKTSLLRTLVGLTHPEAGRVIWNGADTRNDRAAFHRELAYLGHDAPLKPELTPTENLRFNVGLRRAVTATQIEAALGEVGAGNFADRPVRTLSAGQRRRVALAGLLLAAVPLWVLDEPATNLDSAGHALVGYLIDAHLGQGGLVIAAIHHGLALDSSRVSELPLGVN